MNHSPAAINVPSSPAFWRVLSRRYCISRSAGAEAERDGETSALIFIRHRLTTRVRVIISVNNPPRAQLVLSLQTRAINRDVPYEIVE